MMRTCIEKSSLLALVIAASCDSAAGAFPTPEPPAPPAAPAKVDVDEVNEAMKRAWAAVDAIPKLPPIRKVPPMPAVDEAMKRAWAAVDAIPKLPPVPPMPAIADFDFNHEFKMKMDRLGEKMEMFAYAQPQPPLPPQAPGPAPAPPGKLGRYNARTQLRREPLPFRHASSRTSRVRRGCRSLRCRRSEERPKGGWCCTTGKLTRLRNSAAATNRSLS